MARGIDHVTRIWDDLVSIAGPAAFVLLLAFYGIGFLVLAWISLSIFTAPLGVAP